MSAGGVDIAPSTSDFRAKLLEFIPPSSVPAPVVWHWLRGTLDQARRNWGSGASSTVAGVPAAPGTYLTLQGNVNYLNSPALWTGELTIAWVARAAVQNPTGSARPVFWSTEETVSAVNKGISCFLSSTTGADTKVTATATDGTNTRSTTLPVNTTQNTDWAFRIMRYSEANAFLWLEDLTKGQSQKDTIAVLPARNAQPIRIGHNYRTNFQGIEDFTFFGAWNSLLADLDRSNLYTAVKADLAVDGIVI